jgi:hypothetical protein
MSNSLAQQWGVIERPALPTITGYGARGAVGPGPSGAIYPPPAGGLEYLNQCQDPAYPGPYTAPVGVTLGTGWTFNRPYRQVEINATPAGNVDAVFTLQPNDGSLFTVGEKIQILLLGFMQSGTMTVLVGGQGIGVNITAAQWNAAAALMPGLGYFRTLVAVPALGTAKTITLRFPAGTLAQAQMKSVTVFQDYADWTDFQAANAGFMTA